MKTIRLGVALFRVCRRTDMKKLTVAIPNYANAPKPPPPNKFSYRVCEKERLHGILTAELPFRVTVWTLAPFILYLYNDFGARTGVTESYLDVTTTRNSTIIDSHRRKSIIELDWITAPFLRLQWREALLPGWLTYHDQMAARVVPLKLCMRVMKNYVVIVFNL